MENIRTTIELHPDHWIDGVKAIAGAVLQNKPGDKIMLFTSKWDQDPRELYDITEAANLFLATCTAAGFLVGMDRLVSCLCRETLTLILLCDRQGRIDG